MKQKLLFFRFVRRQRRATVKGRLRASVSLWLPYPGTRGEGNVSGSQTQGGGRQIGCQNFAALLSRLPLHPRPLPQGEREDGARCSASLLPCSCAGDAAGARV